MRLDKLKEICLILWTQRFLNQNGTVSRFFLKSSELSHLRTDESSFFHSIIED